MLVRKTLIHASLALFSLPPSFSNSLFLSSPLAYAVFGWLSATCRSDALGTARAPCHLCHSLAQQPAAPYTHIHSQTHTNTSSQFAPVSVGEDFTQETQTSHCPLGEFSDIYDDVLNQDGPGLPG